LIFPAPHDSRLEKRSGDVSNLFWLTDEQMATFPLSSQGRMASHGSMTQEGTEWDYLYQSKWVAVA
jgi:hypothetical protein